MCEYCPHTPITLHLELHQLQVPSDGVVEEAGVGVQELHQDLHQLHVPGDGVVEEAGVGVQEVLPVAGDVLQGEVGGDELGPCLCYTPAAARCQQ